MLLHFIFSLLLITISVCDVRVLQKIHVHPESGEFVDEWGRVRLFHGINSVIKGFPWYDVMMLDPERQQQIAGRIKV